MSDRTPPAELDPTSPEGHLARVVGRVLVVVAAVVAVAELATGLWLAAAGPSGTAALVVWAVFAVQAAAAVPVVVRMVATGRGMAAGTVGLPSR